MPYQTGRGPPILDVFRANNVYANKKLVALWEEPAPSPAVGAPEAIQVNLSLTQSEAVATSGAAATSAAEAEVKSIQLGYNLGPAALVVGYGEGENLNGAAGAANELDGVAFVRLTGAF
jgi:hypothetical protein